MIKFTNFQNKSDDQHTASPEVTEYGGILFFKMNKFIQHNFKEILIHNLMYNNKAL